MTTHGTPTAARQTHPVAQMVAIGDELLSGDVVNSNSTYVGERCRRLGIPLTRVLCVRDRIGEIADAVHAATADAEICLVCGGLGPTTDDLTAEALAHAAGVAVGRNAEALTRLEVKFAAVSRTMPEANRKQADFPVGAEILPNPIGSAEGFALTINGCRVFALPGVPRELRLMMTAEVEPRIGELVPVHPTVRRMFRVLGRGESSVARSLEPVLEAARARSPGLSEMFVHYRASMPEVLVILEALPNADGERASAGDLRGLDEAFEQVLAPGLYGIGEAPLAERVVKALQARSLRIGTGESCTGGGVGKLIASIPGASEVFDGGVIAYENRIKTALLRVSASTLEQHGAVSAPVAREMARGVCETLGSDLGVAITGIAGPTGGTPEKPVGTVHIAVCDPDGVEHKQLQLRGSRGNVQRSAELWALKMVWDRLHARGLASIEEMSS